MVLEISIFSLVGVIFLLIKFLKEIIYLQSAILRFFFTKYQFHFTKHTSLLSRVSQLTKTEL